MSNTEEELARFLGDCFRVVLAELARTGVPMHMVPTDAWTAAGRGFIRGLKRKGLVVARMPLGGM